MRKQQILIATFNQMADCFTSREFYDELRMNGFKESWFEGDAVPKFLKDKCYHEFRAKTWEKINFNKPQMVSETIAKHNQQIIEYTQQEVQKTVEKPTLNETDCVIFLKSLGYKLFKTVEI